ncbi:MAG: hypothetical protein IH943_12410 [Acidobacteria bacterium]|nr:hypothetical protein [Acidobacteriota bacterium]
MATTPSTITREAGTSTPAVRPGRKRPSLSHILIALAVVLAFGLNFLALQSRDAAVLVAVADTDLTEGSVLTSDALRLVEVPADLQGLEGLLTESELAGVEGWIVGRSIPAGDLIDEASLIAPASHVGLRLMSIPIAAEHAAGASITIGDRVDVISVIDGEARFVATALEVANVADTDQGSLSGGGGYFVVVAVDSAQALALASAIDDGSMEVVRSTGAEPLGEES